MPALEWRCPHLPVTLPRPFSLNWLSRKSANAEPLYVQCLAGSRRAFGDDHYNTAVVIQNLALLYAAQGNFANAAPLLHELAEWCLAHPKGWGTYHHGETYDNAVAPVIVLSKLIDCYVALGQPQKAIRWRACTNSRRISLCLRTSAVASGSNLSKALIAAERD